MRIAARLEEMTIFSGPKMDGERSMEKLDDLQVSQHMELALIFIEGGIRSVAAANRRPSKEIAQASEVAC
jgi:hypothetical protein